MSDPYNFDYSAEEIALLKEHDRYETLHAYLGEYNLDDTYWGGCVECGDDSSGLMHNNTWRNVEPLMDYMSEREYRRDQAERSGNSSANWGFTVGP